MTKCKDPTRLSNTLDVFLPTGRPHTGRHARTHRPPPRRAPVLDGPLLRRAHRARPRLRQPGHRRRGRSYLDFFGGILTNMLGYDIPEVREAVERQLATGIVHTSTLYLIRSQVELAEKIARLSGIADAKVFFTNSGTEANEAALLLATDRPRSQPGAGAAQQLPRPVVRHDGRSPATGAGRPRASAPFSVQLPAQRLPAAAARSRGLDDAELHRGLRRRPARHPRHARPPATWPA